MKQNNYLGTEKISVLLRKFAIPCIFSLIISCLYNIVDQIFVGNGVGYLGNAATGVIFPITVIGWGVSLLFGDGAAADLSVSYGKNETQDIHTSVGNSMLGSFLCGSIYMRLRSIGSEKLWKCMETRRKRVEKILSGLIWRGRLITRVSPERSGAIHISMSYV